MVKVKHRLLADRAFQLYFLYGLSSLIVVISMWFTWLISGSASRNSFAMIEVADVFASSSTSFVSLFRAIWIFTPVVILAGLVLLMAQFRRSGLLLNCLGVLVVSVTALYVGYQIGWQLGQVIALIGGLLTTIVGVAVVRQKPTDSHI